MIDKITKLYREAEMKVLAICRRQTSNVTDTVTWSDIVDQPIILAGLHQENLGETYVAVVINGEGTDQITDLLSEAFDKVGESERMFTRLRNILNYPHRFELVMGSGVDVAICDTGDMVNQLIDVEFELHDALAVHENRLSDDDFALSESRRQLDEILLGLKRTGIRSPR
ncbi:hypothetical protein SPFM10_00069 [Salmonella phage SPFM10]|nr:hypothetical protein SPFM10_00069 [Salmonella phage SPFM10]